MPLKDVNPALVCWRSAITVCGSISTAESGAHGLGFIRTGFLNAGTSENKENNDTACGQQLFHHDFEIFNLSICRDMARSRLQEIADFILEAFRCPRFFFAKILDSILKRFPCH